MSAVPEIARPQARPGEHVILVCPVCGCPHRVPPHVARKVERRLRSGRCPNCCERGVRSAPRELTERERATLGRWWLDRFSDEELAEIVAGFGIETSPDAVSRSRAQGATHLTGDE